MRAPPCGREWGGGVVVLDVIHDLNSRGRPAKKSQKLAVLRRAQFAGKRKRRSASLDRQMQMPARENLFDASFVAEGSRGKGAAGRGRWLCRRRGRIGRRLGSRFDWSRAFWRRCRRGRIGFNPL